MPALRDHAWRLKYTPDNGDLVRAFYVPLLDCAVRYDRLTGYFSASALALAARGVEGLVRNGGHMRMVVGCTLEADLHTEPGGHAVSGSPTHEAPRPLRARGVDRIAEAPEMRAAGAPLQLRIASMMGVSTEPGQTQLTRMLSLTCSRPRPSSACARRPSMRCRRPPRAPSLDGADASVRSSALFCDCRLQPSRNL